MVNGNHIRNPWQALAGDAPGFHPGPTRFKSDGHGPLNCFHRMRFVFENETEPKYSTPQQPTNGENMGYKRMSREMKKTAKRIITEFFQKFPDASAAEIANELNQQKIEQPHFGVWDEKTAARFVHHHMGGIGAVRKKTAKIDDGAGSAVTPSKTKSDKLALAELVLSASMADDEKSRLLSALFS